MLFVLSQHVDGYHAIASATLGTSSAYGHRVERLGLLSQAENKRASRGLGALTLESLGVTALIFERALSGIQSHYTIVLDKSGSMMKPEEEGEEETRWECAQDCADHMYEALTKQGHWEGASLPAASSVDLWLFSSEAMLWPNIASDEEVETIFESNCPSGTTNMCHVLTGVAQRHTELRPGRCENVLLVTDGEPNNKSAVKELLINSINTMSSSEELAISILQMGDDAPATAFLKDLQEHLVSSGCKYNSIEVVPCSAMCGMPFNEFLRHRLPRNGILPDHPYVMPDMQKEASQRMFELLRKRKISDWAALVRDQISKAASRRSITPEELVKRAEEDCKARSEERMHVMDVERREWEKLSRLNTPADWVPDDDAPRCLLCLTRFGVISPRRHHCRRCGSVVCQECSQHEVPMPDSYTHLTLPTKRIV
eukprot:TRINITY_DN40208_c0_g1_i1.p1 TRINITY_DN40208_c0_g1~~TRINITY_DN40208_c0_g1_i1.p1  ORF type:complete len:428 (+),score=91.44 TRINITY_DN40208_c0_g1_i1:278-1561(+)